MLSVTITNGVIRQQELLADTSKKDSSNLDQSITSSFGHGDIVYNKMRAWQGAVGASDYRGIVSPAYIVQRPSEGVNTAISTICSETPAFAKEAERWSYGITSDMWSLRPEHFKMIYACLPPLPEQAAIVRFLDHADRRIQRYIRARAEADQAACRSRSRPSSIVPSPAASTPTSASSPPGWNGWATCRNIGKCEASAARLPLRSEPGPVVNGIVLPGPSTWTETPVVQS